MAFDPSTTKPEIDFPGDQAPSELVIETSRTATVPRPAPARHHQGALRWRGPLHRRGVRRVLEPARPPGVPPRCRPGHPRLGRGHRGDEGRRPRRLTIPAHMAYGDRGAGNVIKPGRRSSSSSTSSASPEHTPPALSRPARAGGLSAFFPCPGGIPSGSGRPRGTPRVLLEATAHGRQAHRSLPKRGVQAVDGHLHQRQAAAGGLRQVQRLQRHECADRPVEAGQPGPGGHQRDPPVMPCGCGVRCRGGAGAHPLPRRAARRRRGHRGRGRR